MSETAKETMGFQTEAKQLLQLMIHSLYSNKEIFLRELISNSSDACEKLRFEAVSNGALFEDDPELQITIDLDKDAKTITIADNGIGMTSDEMRTALTPFGRVRNKLAYFEPGTGLGLPLARRLIETMNGWFEFDSEPEKGTEVSIILPAA